MTMSLRFPIVLIIFGIAAFSAITASAKDDLVRQKLTIHTSGGSFDFQVELADDPDERRIGLMHRTEMDPRHGMLFDFGEIQPVAMWMRNTPLPLDMLFIRKDRSIARIAQRTTPFSEEIISSGEPVAYVLEINAGISALIGAKAGDRVDW